MLKSLQWKLVLVFMSLVVAIMLVLGVFLQGSVASFYCGKFSEKMEEAFTEQFIGELKSLASDATISEFCQLLIDKSPVLELSESRICFVLNGITGEVVYSSNNDTHKPEGTKNITSALEGKDGNIIDKRLKILDYARPISGKDKYVVYVLDNKEHLNGISKSIVDIVIRALFASIVVSGIFGYSLSKTITLPITKLTRRTERFAQGDFESRIDVKTNDEIGRLARTFNYMSLVVRKSMSEREQERRKLETVLKYMADGVMAFDISGGIMLTNPAAQEILDQNKLEATKFDVLFEQLGLDTCIAEFAYLDYDHSIERELSVGSRHYIVHFAQIKLEGDRAGGVVVVFQDKTQTQKMDDMRKEFVANVSHELRTPLTTVKGYSETILEGLDESRDQERYFLSVICREVDRMTRIVKDLLTLSNMDANSMAQSKRYFSVDEMLRDVVKRFAFDAEVRNQKLIYEAATSIPEIYADRDRIEQVIVNIISNAMKYTPDKTGVVAVYAGSLYNEVYIKVRDNGIGIPSKDLPRIFERFYRVDKARSRDKGGTGLGLAIAQEIIRLHGGEISITSQVSKGTEVLIKLPIIGGEDAEPGESLLPAG